MRSILTLYEHHSVQHVNIANIGIALFKFDNLTCFMWERWLYLIELHIKYNIFIDETKTPFSYTSSCMKMKHEKQGNDGSKMKTQKNDVACHENTRQRCALQNSSSYENHALPLQGKWQCLLCKLLRLCLVRI